LDNEWCIRESAQQHTYYNIQQIYETKSKNKKLTVRIFRLHTRRTRHGRGIGSTERGSGAELVSSNPGVPRQRFDKPGVLPAAGDPGEEVLLLASEAAHAGIGVGTATDCANIDGRCRRGSAPNSFSRRGSAASRNGRPRRSGRGFALHSDGMIDLSQVRRYYVACGYTDLRRGIDRLAAIVTQPFGAQLNQESLILFCGRRTDRIKALYWSGDGYLLLYKRLC